MISYDKKSDIMRSTFYHLSYQGEDSIDDDVLNSYCWMYSSFDIPPDFTGPCTRRRYDGTKLYNTYYQWVSIFLGTLSILFYIPRCIWMVLEGNLMAYIVKGNLLMALIFFIFLKLENNFEHPQYTFLIHIHIDFRYGVHDSRRNK